MTDGRMEGEVKGAGVSVVRSFIHSLFIHSFSDHSTSPSQLCQPASQSNPKQGCLFAWSTFYFCCRLVEKESPREYFFVLFCVRLHGTNTVVIPLEMLYRMMTIDCPGVRMCCFPFRWCVCVGGGFILDDSGHWANEAKCDSSWKRGVV